MTHNYVIFDFVSFFQLDVTTMLIENAEQIFSIENAYDGIEWVNKKKRKEESSLKFRK